MKQFIRGPHARSNKSKRMRRKRAYSTPNVGSDEDLGRIVLGAGILGLGTYGAYKLFSGRSGEPGQAKQGGPWLYKLNPSYWIKSSAEKRYLDVEKQRGERNVELRKELAAAERAYWTSSAAAEKESKVSNIEAQLKKQGAISGEERMSAKPWMNEFTHLPAKEVRLSPAKRRLPWQGAHTPVQVGNDLSPDDPAYWNSRFSKSAARGDSGTRSTMTFRPTKTALGDSHLTPDDPAYWNSHFSKTASKRDSGTLSTMAFRPSKTALGLATPGKGPGTEFSTMMPTTMKTFRSTEFKMSGPGTEAPTVMNTSMPTVDSTEFKMTGIGADFVGDGKPGFDQNTDKRAVVLLQKSGTPITPGTIWSVETANNAANALVAAFKGDKAAAGKWLIGFLERTQISWFTPDGAIYGYRGGRKYLASPPAMKSRPGAMVAVMGAATGKPRARATTSNIARHAGFISQAANAHAQGIAVLAQKMGLAGKNRWTGAERDAMAMGLMKQMQSAVGTPADAQDAHVARQVVKVWGGARGVAVEGETDDMGNVFGTIGKIATAPIVYPAKAMWWGAKQVGRGVRGVGRKLGIVKRPPNATQRKQAALIAAAKRRAAAAARIRAAEQKHEAAVMEREEARRVAEVQAAAQEAEAAAAEAEAIAIEAQAMQNVADVPSLEEDGYEISGDSVECQSVENVGFWSVVGNVSVPVGKAALVAATATKGGAQIRAGAKVARAARKSPAVRQRLGQLQTAAKKGDAKSAKVLRQVSTGAKADAQRTDALIRDAQKKRGLARKLRHFAAKTVKFGVGPGWPGFHPRAIKPVSFTEVAGTGLIKRGQPAWVARLASGIAKPRLPKLLQLGR